MKILILLSLIVCALGEPPVRAGYPAARSNTNVDIQKSLSFDYGLPLVDEKSSYLPSYESSSRSRSFQKSGLARTQPGYSYGAPNARSLSQSYDAPSAGNTLSQVYGPSSARNSLSNKYGVPSTRNSISQEYGVPSAKDALSEEYGVQSARGTLSQEYGAPAVRNSLSQEYGVPSARNTVSQEYSAPAVRNSLSQEYGVPSARNTVSQEYSAPAVRNSLSQEYGAPAARNSLSQHYGVPAARNSLSQEYRPPSSRGLSQEYGAPAPRDYLSQVYGAPNARSLSQQYGPPSSRISQQYGTPEFSGSDRHSARNSLSNSYGTPLQISSTSSFNSPGFEPVPSEEYGVPSANAIPDDYTVPTARFNKGQSYSRNSGFGGRVSSQYSAPNARSGAKSSYAPSSSYGAPKPSTEYGTPEARSDLKTDAYASGYSSARSTSNTYLPPSPMPSQQYGVPDQYSSLSSQGYGYARNALNELLNQEPASYDFGYKVNDYQSGSDFGHTESRQDNKAEGSYFVVLPDGTKQTVEYEADERGFKPKISVEPVETGYDDNAANIRSADGPY